MPWFFPWSESIKKRACRYLLQHYLGRFLETKLGLEQLSVDLYKGTGCVKEVSLDVEALNDLSEEQGFPVKFLDGSIAEVCVSVPWSALLSESSFVEIKGLTLVVEPKQQSKNAFLWESMINSIIMTTSMQLAEECLKQQNEEDGEPPAFEGLELFAQTLETVLARIKVRLIDTVIRLEYVPQNSLSGVGFEIHIKKIDYYDLAGSDHGSTLINQGVKEKSVYATKKFGFEGVSLYSDEFPSLDKTPSQSRFSSGDVSEFDGDNDKKKEEKVDSLVIFGKLSGRHEITIRFKQCDSIIGPKIELDVTLGSALMFLSPRQFHCFYSILEKLMLPTEVNLKTKRCEKPMLPSDYQRIESELLLTQQQQFRQTSYSTIQSESLNRKGWSAGYLDDSDEDFHPFETVQSEKIESFESSFPISSRSEPPMNSSTFKTWRSSENFPIGEENLSRRMRFSLKLGSLVALLLHEDIMVCNSTTGQLSKSTVLQMRSLAEIFFSQLGLFSFAGAGTKDLSITEEKLDAACSKSHLRLILTPLTLTGCEQDSNSGTTLEMQLVIALADLVECLKEKTAATEQSKFDCCPLLTFPAHSDGGQVKPNINMKFVSYQPSRSMQKVRNPTKPEVHINSQFSPCEVEIDISIIDRITVLLNRPAFLCSNKAKFSQMYQEKLPCVDAVLDDDLSCQTVISLSSPRINVKLRFPIPDLRPIHDLQRTPWWRRSLRNDILTIELHEALINTILIPNETETTYQVASKEVKCLYQLEVGQESFAFLHSTAQDEDDSVNMADGAGNYDLPRITFTLRPSRANRSDLEDQEDTQAESEEDDTNEMTLSTGESLLGLPSAQPSPFSKQRRIHKGHNPRNESSNLDELLTPGNSEEMAEFIAAASNKCTRWVDVSLPKVTILLPSQHFFEVLYNRLSADLCLWEPSAPEYFTPTHGPPFHEVHKSASYGGIGSALLQSPIPGMFIMCKSGVAYESNSESDEECESNHLSYLRTHQENSKTKRCSKDLPSKMCVSVNIGKGSCTLFCQLKDSSEIKSISHHGEVQFTVEDARLFSVTSFGGDSNTGYVCFQATKAYLSHSGYIMDSSEGDIDGSRIHHTSRVDPVIYPSSNDTRSVISESEPMLSVAIKIMIDPRLDIKTLKTAISLTGGTLRHRFTPSHHSWFNQIIDFFDVVDYPIQGYYPPTVITELHLNLSNCGVDYRPLYLPARVFLSIGSMNLSSNIVAHTSTSLLRFVVEDAALYLSNRVSYGTINLHRDYVSVLNIDLLELSLRLHTKQSKQPPSHIELNGAPKVKCPLFELDTSFKIVRIQTCADSCRLLLDLLTYLADDGDFDEKGIALSENSSESDLTIRSSMENLKDNSVLSRHGHEMEVKVNNLMAEAMLDSSPNLVCQTEKAQAKEELISSPTEVFFFPDENQPQFRVNQQEAVGMPELLTDPCRVWNEGVDQNLIDDAIDSAFDDKPTLEEDFCILENDPGVGFTPRGGEPQIRSLISTPVQLIEGHFPPPIGKTDVLKAPKHFPVPVMRYTLHDMVLIWEIFGGQDFSSASNSNTSKLRHPKTVTFSKGNDQQEKVKIGSFRGPSPSGCGATSRTTHKPNLQKCSGRDVNVKLELHMNKVRLVHEVYPEDTFQASRQVLTVGDIEIRDRLAESHINKFLYQYCCEARPKQAHANMIMVKALQVRPEILLPTLECCLKVSILPLRLHVDQDTLAFMNEFSTALSEAGCYNDEEERCKAPSVSVPTPVMGVAGEMGSSNTPGNVLPNYSDSLSISDSKEPTISPPIYFRSFTFSPDVLIRFDYHGKGVDLSQGPSFSGLLVGLGQLNCSQLNLKRLSHRHGLLGIQKLVAYALNEWLLDIKKNQLPSICAGVGPLHSIVQLVQGIRDLFWLPIEQFQKDGRIVRGLQRGANAFSTSAALALLELTSRMIQTLQSAAETAYDVVSPGPSFRRKRPGSRGRRRRYAQPLDIRDGVTKAYQVVREGLGETAQTLMRVANEEAEQKGMTGAVGGVLRQIPSTVVKPIILATEATVNVLGGVQSQLMPDTRREAIEKWRQED